MTIHTRFARTFTAVAAVLIGAPLEVQARDALNAAVARYDNACSVRREHAFDAFCEARPAFWTSARYHDQFAMGLLYPLNKEGLSVADALAFVYPAHHADKRMAGLDSLVPLNAKAVAALADAYEAIGTFRDIDELEARKAVA